MIKRLILKNFKGFKNLDISFEGNRHIILGGKNGFGKTSIFDAVELILTGNIKRYSKYRGLADNRRNYSQTKKPLVCDMDVESVELQGLFDFGNGPIWLKREAKTKDMKNPINLDVFHKLWSRSPSDDAYKIAETNIIPGSILNNFDFIHYLDQEESNDFLHHKEDERNKTISQLFNTEYYDVKLDKLTLCLEELKKIGKEFENSRNEVIQNKEKIASKNFGLPTNHDDGYIALANGKYRWDIKAEELKYVDYESFLIEGGVLDNLLYLCQHLSEYKRNARNEYLKSLLEENALYRLSVYVFLSNAPNAKWLSDYIENLQTSIQLLNSSNLNSIHLSWDNRFTGLIDENEVIDLQKLIEEYSKRIKSLDNLNKSYLNLHEQRNGVIRSLKSVDLSHLEKCPICGQDYCSHDALIHQIDVFGIEFKNYCDRALNDLLKSIEGLKEKIKEIIIVPIQTFLTNNNITVDICRSFDVSQQKVTEFLNKKFNVVLEKKTSLDDQILYITNVLQANFIECDPSLDYSLLKKTYASYGKDLNMDLFSIGNLNSKRIYLTNAWNTNKNSLIKEYDEKISRLSKVIADTNNKKTQVSRLKNLVITAKEKYIDKLISDVEILFYVYTGRIMQDNNLGCGVFLQNKDHKRVLFVNGDINNEVDALYNMSSGQLTAVVLALILSINKLYASCKFLAIDDPLQTLDDMNYWGFIETIRHEFHDYTVLLSTHEEEYGGLMRYKCAKFQIPAKLFNIQDYRESHTQSPGN